MWMFYLQTPAKTVPNSKPQSFLRTPDLRKVSKMLHLWWRALRYSPWTSSARWPFREQLARSTFSSSCLLCSSSSVAKLKYTAKTSLKSCFTACHKHTERAHCVGLCMCVCRWFVCSFHDFAYYSVKHQLNRCKDSFHTHIHISSRLYLDLGKEFSEGWPGYRLWVPLLLMMVRSLCLLFLVPTEFPQTLERIEHQHT